MIQKHMLQYKFIKNEGYEVHDSSYNLLYLGLSSIYAFYFYCTWLFTYLQFICDRASITLYLETLWVKSYSMCICMPSNHAV